MNKMNLREFAEVLVAMMNQQGTVCFLNNDNPAKQLAVAMSKGDACAYAPVAPLWDSYEKGADLNQMAAAVSMAMKEGLGKGSEMVKMNADRCAQQPAPSMRQKRLLTVLQIWVKTIRHIQQNKTRDSQRQQGKNSSRILKKEDRRQ